MHIRKYRQLRLRLLASWREILTLANALAPESDDIEDLEALASVKDYIIDQIDVHESWLKIGVSAAKIASENAQFATPENGRHNGLTAGAR